MSEPGEEEEKRGEYQIPFDPSNKMKENSRTAFSHVRNVRKDNALQRNRTEVI
jgi:hypothetical protein